MSQTSLKSENWTSVGLLGGLLLALALIAAAPFYQYVQLRQVSDTEQAGLATSNAELARESHLREENKQLIATGQDASLLLEGDTTGIAGANLQQLMSTLVVENKGTPTTSQILAPKAEYDLVRIGMSLSLSIDTDGLVNLLHSIETRSPLIFIDELKVSSADSSSFSAPDPNFMGPLEVTLIVSGYTSKSKVPAP